MLYKIGCICKKKQFNYNICDSFNKLIERFIKEKHVELSAKKQRELIAPTMSEYNKMTFWEQNEVGHRLHFFNNNDYFCNGNFRRKWRTQQRKSIQINDNL